MPSNLDPGDLQQAQACLKEHGVTLEVVPAERNLHPEHWNLSWSHGSMGLLATASCDPNTAVCAAALFVRLWLAGLDVGLARDLACSYFDPRIGRPANSSL